ITWSITSTFTFTFTSTERLRTRQLPEIVVEPVTNGQTCPCPISRTQSVYGHGHVYDGLQPLALGPERDQHVADRVERRVRARPVIRSRQPAQLLDRDVSRLHDAGPHVLRDERAAFDAIPFEAARARYAWRGCAGRALDVRAAQLERFQRVRAQRV